MERYRILEHTADGKFRAFGATLEEAFSNAALAMASLMYDWAVVGRRVERAAALEARDLEQLLNKFLTEILYLLDAKKFVLAGVEDLKIELPDKKAAAAGSSLRLTVRFLGDDDPAAYEFHGDVKAVTYNEMKIEHGCCGWTVQVVVDM